MTANVAVELHSTESNETRLL